MKRESSYAQQSAEHARRRAATARETGDQRGERLWNRRAEQYQRHADGQSR